MYIIHLEFECNELNKLANSQNVYIYKSYTS